MLYIRIILIIFLIRYTFNTFSENKEIILYEKKFNSIDPEFKYFYDKFFILTNAEPINNLTMGFSPLGNEYSGVCFTTLDNKKEIVVDPFYWQASSELMKEMLIAHELGHCVCNRDHTSYEDLEWYNLFFYRIISEKINGFLYDGCPDSLMHFSDFPEFCYMKHFMYYWSEMHDSCKKN